MIYFFKSPYTVKLYNRLKANHPDIALIDLESLDTIRFDDKLIIDASDLIALTARHFSHDDIIVMGDGDIDATMRFGRTISKYQSYKRIEALILDASYPVTFFTHTAPLSIDETQLSIVSDQLDIDYRISLNFDPTSNFSLYNHLIGEDCTFEKEKTQHVITCIKDYLNPPINDLVAMIAKLKRMGRVLIYSAPLKGPLDYALINLSDTVLILHDENHGSALDALTHVIPPEKIKRIKRLDTLDSVCDRKLQP